MLIFDEEKLSKAITWAETYNGVSIAELNCACGHPARVHLELMLQSGYQFVASKECVVKDCECKSIHGDDSN